MFEGERWERGALVWEREVTWETEREMSWNEKRKEKRYMFLVTDYPKVHITVPIQKKKKKIPLSEGTPHESWPNTVKELMDHYIKK